MTGDLFFVTSVTSVSQWFNQFYVHYGLYKLVTQSMRRVKIIGTGSYVPEKVLTNRDLEKMVDTSDEWIRTRTGMSERHIASEKDKASDLAIKAAHRALKDNNIPPEDIDIILVATATPDMFFPSTACFVQSSIGAKRSVAFDISAACSGYIFALSVAEQYIKSGKYTTVLLISTEVCSRYIDWTDRNTCVLFGDGAAATVLKGVNGNRKDGIISTHIYSDGRYADLLYMRGGGSSYPLNHESIDNKLHFLKMKGNALFKIAVKNMTEVAREALAFNGYKISDIDLLIPHQANKRIIDAVAKNLDIPQEKIFINIEKYGNTSAVSIPLALDEALKEGRIEKGDLILMVAFGGGLTWGSALIKW
jgi:3-oxoacyl-[acyl-carrier-protein] synthase-3